jgi:hypothetical protein
MKFNRKLNTKLVMANSLTISVNIKTKYKYNYMNLKQI